MILNVRVRCFVLVLGDGPHVLISRKNGDDVVTPCTLKTVTFLTGRRSGLGFVIEVFHNPLLRDG